MIGLVFRKYDCEYFWISQLCCNITSVNSTFIKTRNERRKDIPQNFASQIVRVRDNNEPLRDETDVGFYVSTTATIKNIPDIEQRWKRKGKFRKGKTLLHFALLSSRSGFEFLHLKHSKSLWQTLNHCWYLHPVTFNTNLF